MSSTDVVRYITVNKTKFSICGEGLYKADKLFASPVKEEVWLNSIAKKGFELTKRTVGGYYFVQNTVASNWYYSVTYSPVSSSSGALSEEAERIVKENEGKAELLFTYGTKMYFKTKFAPTQNADDEEVNCVSAFAAEKRRRMKRYFWFAFSVMTVFLALLCYNLKYWVRFRVEDIHPSFQNGKLNDYMVKDHSLWDYTIDMREWFGEYPCTPHISLFLTLTVLAIPFVVYYLDQYLHAIQFEKAVNEKCKKI